MYVYFQLVADSCNLQCWKLSYVCSAMMNTNICMCGDIPTDMIGTSYTCPKSAIEIRCTLASNTTVAIDVGYCESSLVKPLPNTISLALCKIYTVTKHPFIIIGHVKATNAQ